jgi:hypothetical protein
VQTLAGLGLFREAPEEAVFTVEYSPARRQRQVTPCPDDTPGYKVRYDPRALLRAFLALSDIHAHAQATLWIGTFDFGCWTGKPVW